MPGNREEETVSKSVRFSLRDTPRRLSSWRMEDGLDVQNTYISVGCVIETLTVLTGG